MYRHTKQIPSSAYLRRTGDRWAWYLYRGCTLDGEDKMRRQSRTEQSNMLEKYGKNAKVAHFLLSLITKEVERSYLSRTLPKEETFYSLT